MQVLIFTTLTQLQILILRRGSVHMNQVDVPFILPWYYHRLAEASCTIDHHIAMELNNRLMLSFLQKHLGNLIGLIYCF